MAELKEKKQPVVARGASAAFRVDVRPFNCPTDLTADGKRCPNCNQIHLRPGYCQALDPINAAKYPQFHVTDKPVSAAKYGAETATDISVANEINELGESATVAATDKPSPVCEMCGGTFTSRRSDARYCSATCRSKAHRGGQR